MKIGTQYAIICISVKQPEDKDVVAICAQTVQCKYL